ncbi:MAG: hypothetical protein JST19_04710 [Bacteroidetes bacterium]|nr:hypothetical protein [Bacteroidota bacterium]
MARKPTTMNLCPILTKILLGLTLIVTTFTFAQAQTGWVDYKIDDKLSVKLPGQPEITGKGVTAHTKDSLSCFVYKIVEIDSSALAKAISSPGFLDGLKGAMASSQTGLSLGEMKAAKWNGYNRYSVDGTNPSMKLKASFVFLIVGGRIYALGAMMPESHDINEKNIFFNTLKLN